MSIKKFIAITAVIAFGFIVTACSNTRITGSWAQVETQDGYKSPAYSSPMVIAISDSQQTRRIYENSLVAALKEEGVTATPSYLLINSKQKINQDTVLSAIQDAAQSTNATLIDSVLISYLAVADTELTHQDSPLSATYSGDADDNMISATLITSRGRFNNKEVISLKNDIYDVQKQSIVWSAQTKTDDLSTVDALVLSVTEALVEKLVDDKVFK